MLFWCIVTESVEVKVKKYIRIVVNLHVCVCRPAVADGRLATVCILLNYNCHFHCCIGLHAVIEINSFGIWIWFFFFSPTLRNCRYWVVYVSAVTVWPAVMTKYGCTVHIYTAIGVCRNLVSASQDGKLIVWDGYTTNKVSREHYHLISLSHNGFLIRIMKLSLIHIWRCRRRG